jgi:hypothetical protein
MRPVIKTLTFSCERASGIKEFLIRKKDYGEMILYDILFKDLFLFTLGQDGKVLLSNWEAARSDQIGMDEDVLSEINRFILNTA